MKVLVLWSSPNKEGLTASAEKYFCDGVKNEGALLKEINLNYQNIKYCQACGNGWGTCRREGKCILKDDFQRIYDSLIEADGIVFISAVYWHDMTECMKAFMDRLRRCETAHNHFLVGKRCFLIACAGGTGLGAVECLHNMEETLKHMDMKACDRIPLVRFNQDYMLPVLEKAGETFVRRLETGFDMGY